MDEIYVTYVDDEHVDNHDYDDTTDDDHDNNNGLAWSGPVRPGSGPGPVILYFAFFNFAFGVFGNLPCQNLNFATLYFAVEPCLGMNGYPIARNNTILRQD